MSSISEEDVNKTIKTKKEKFKPSFIKRTFSFKPMWAIAFIVLFGLLGVYLLLRSFAATLLIKLEAEQMSLPTGATIIDDITASSGKATAITTRGNSSGVVTLSSSATSLSVIAKIAKCQNGERYSPDSQKITVSVDGNKLFNTPISATAWTKYSINVDLKAASHRVSIWYNGGNNKCAPVLYLDAVEFYGTQVLVSAPSVSLTASPNSVVAGSNSNLTWNSSNVTSCTASGSWSGNKPVNGTVSTGALNTTSTYGLSCSGSGGSSSASVTVTVNPSVTLPTTGRFGYSAHIARMSDKTTYVGYISTSNAKTVRDDFVWSEIEPTKGSFNWSTPDQIMTIVANNNLDLLAMVGYTPLWARVSGCTTSDKCAPANVNDFANFVTQIAKRYGPNGTFWAANATLPYHPLQAIEIWNEPNIHFWLPAPDPAKYTAMLKVAYSAIKAVNPGIQVISAGLSPYGKYGDGSNSGAYMNPLSYLEKMYQAGAAGYMDAIGWHPYNYAQGRTANGMLAYHEANAWSQMYQTTPSVRSLMINYGDGSKKIWATEIGAPTSTNGVTEVEQASFASQTIEFWDNDDENDVDWTGNYYWYDMRDDCTDNANVECAFGAIRYNNSQKPVFDVLKTGFLP